jgi:ATP-dependent DNA ligase
MSAFRDLRRRLSARNSAFEPCLPRPAKEPPAGIDWIHEIKHDGFRILARKDGPKVRLITRNGYDLAHRFPLAVDAAALPAGSCLVEAGCPFPSETREAFGVPAAGAFGRNLDRLQICYDVGLDEQSARNSTPC